MSVWVGWVGDGLSQTLYWLAHTEFRSRDHLRWGFLGFPLIELLDYKPCGKITRMVWPWSVCFRHDESGGEILLDEVITELHGTFLRDNTPASVAPSSPLSLVSWIGWFYLIPTNSSTICKTLVRGNTHFISILMKWVNINHAFTTVLDTSKWCDQKQNNL